MQGRLSFTIAAVLGLVLLVQSTPLTKERRDTSSFSQGQRTQVIGPSGSITQDINQNDAGSTAPLEVPAPVSVSRPCGGGLACSGGVVAPAVALPVVKETYEYEVVPSVRYTVKRPVAKVTSSRLDSCNTCAALNDAVPSGSGGAGIGYVGDVSGGNVVGVGGDAGR